MIKPNEIMLGDYFLVGKDVKKYMYVSSVNHSYILFDYINNDGYLYESKKEYIEPIPITEDLLKLIGFKYTYSFKFLTKDIGGLTIDLAKKKDKFIIWIYDEDVEHLIIEIKYLHELQQAIRLVTKKELKVELP